jgi:hypothetical protein
LTLAALFQAQVAELVDYIEEGTPGEDHDMLVAAAEVYLMNDIRDTLGDTQADKLAESAVLV